MATDTPTRWQRVREILDAAAGDSAADYGGVGRPWHLPPARLETVEVYGVRMIAPAKPSLALAPAPAKAGCGCGCATTGQAAAGDALGEGFPRFPGRGAASALVKGLRGQAPYDGSVFPRLPWGGAAVGEEDVRFVSDWIDDGLPAEDREWDLPARAETAETGESVRIDPARVESVVQRAYQATAPDDDGYRPGEVRQRINLDCMTPRQLERFRHAFRELYALNKWPADRRSFNNMALIHQDHCQHGWERFLPWHRVYLYEFELVLQDVVPGVSLPYWDWTMPQYRPECPEKGLVIPPAYQAFLTEASVVWLATAADPPLPKDVAAKVRGMVGEHYPSLHRFFAAMTAVHGVPKEYTRGEHRNRFIDALLAENSLWYPLRYPAEYNQDGRPGTLNSVIHYHYPTAEDMREILALRTFRDFGGGSIYNDSFGFLDQNPHNTMHLWTGGMNPDAGQGGDGEALRGDPGTSRNRGVGVTGRRFHTRGDMYVQQAFGDMFSNLTASYDPVFWPIHVNVDRTWWEWQQLNPSGLPADLDSVLTPWSYTIADTLDVSRFGYEYVKSSSLVPVGADAPVGRLVTRPVDLPRGVRNGFRSAEVRLHRVPQLDRSCFVRVFLNNEHANADTPLDDPSYAGYLAVFGHGECIGGPGHCAVPDRRPYDLRPRSHNTPRNHRVNVTKTARRLIEQGAKSLRVTLVTIGADYCADDELLRLEGVSLSFLD